MTSPSDDSTGLRGSAGIAVAMLVANVATYGFQVVAARFLGPAEYGAVASLMAFLLVLSVPQLGLQATAARRIAADPEHAPVVERAIVRLSYRVGLVLAVGCLALTPLLAHVVRLDNIWPVVLMALSTAPLTVVGAQAGVLQGERRWRSLGVVYLGLGVGRLAVGTACIVLRPDATAAMAAVLAAMFIPMAAGWIALRRPREASAAPAGTLRIRSVLSEIGTSSAALLAFFALTNVDILIARQILDEHTAGLYAGGLIVTKAVLFLPQFVVVVLFPSMSNDTSRRAALVHGLLVMAGTGVACTIGAYALSPVALLFVGGADYAEVESLLWLFAFLGILLATLQFLVYFALGRQSHRSTYLIWCGVVSIIVVGLNLDGLAPLAYCVVAIDAIMVAVLATLALRGVDRSVPVS
ncbi:oligosaccharide flippase family protein [Nocardioides sp. GXZ039]|uniref:oligosaccharide flippase family protein n=1 Tax=Nocardioides sp. GXZ039 TaxID=3136018 RepID=UPI0030F3AF63